MTPLDSEVTPFDADARAAKVAEKLATGPVRELADDLPATVAMEHLGGLGGDRRYESGSPKPADRTDRTSLAMSEFRQNGYERGSVSSVSRFPDAETGTNAVAWEDPLPIDAPPLPVFPVSELGDNLIPFVEAVAEQFQVPVDLPAMTVLGVISAAVGGRRRVRVRPGWEETTSLWVAGLAGSSELKSPLIRKLSEPVRDAEKEMQTERRDLIDQLEQDRRIAEGQMKAAEARAGTAKTSQSRNEATADAKAARQTLTDIGQVPKPPRIIFGDLTPEVAAKRCAEQGGRIAIISAEGGTIEMLAGGYAKEQPNVNFFLNAYSGDAEPVDRITRDTILPEDAHVAMALLFQPAVLDGLARKHSKLHGKGLFGRFLYALPVSKVGSRTENAEPVSEQVNDAYTERIKSLIARVWNSTDDVIEFTAEAAKVLATYRAALEPRLGPQGDLRGVGEWAGKLCGSCARIATLLALFDDPACRAVDDKHVARAVNIAPYLIAHAKQIYELMGRKEEDDSLDVAREVLAWIRRRPQPLEEFTRRDVQRGLSRRVDSAEQVQEALELLIEAGWITPQAAPQRPEGQGGRTPSLRYSVHPWCARTASSLSPAGREDDVSEP